MEALFDKSKEYDEMLNKGISLSGEDKYFFIHGRFKDLAKNLSNKLTVHSILDFGCGIGDATMLLKQYFPDAVIVGTDTADEALSYARIKNSDNGRINYTELKNFSTKNTFDLCFVNGVFHHIPLEQRAEALKLIYDALKPGGVLALFENNPINPGTRMVMKRIPFDRDAIVLYPAETKKLLKTAGFNLIYPPRFLFYFPALLAFLRPFEKILMRLPFGAQYYFIAKK
jgi:SAM-dependent methyltransferase